MHDLEPQPGRQRDDGQRPGAQHPRRDERPEEQPHDLRPGLGVEHEGGPHARDPEPGGLGLVEDPFLGRLVDRVVGGGHAVPGPRLVARGVVVDRGVRPDGRGDHEVGYPGAAARERDAPGALDVDAAQQVPVVVRLGDPREVHDGVGPRQDTLELGDDVVVGPGLRRPDVDAGPRRALVGPPPHVGQAPGDRDDLGDPLLGVQRGQERGPGVAARADDGDPHGASSWRAGRAGSSTILIAPSALRWKMS